MNAIAVPTLLVRKEICLRNIEKMKQKAQQHGVELRPHFKTHQQHEVGRWFKQAGIEKIAVSSLRMAKYFARDGWTDITVAFPLNVRETALIDQLAQEITLNVLVENIEAIEGLKHATRNSLNVFIKVDTGYGRTGLSFEQRDKIDELIVYIAGIGHLNFVGFLGHAGHSYKAQIGRASCRERV